MHNRFDVKCEEFGLSVGDDEGEGGIGAMDVPEDVAKEGKNCGENIKGKKEESDADHTKF